MDIAYLFKQIQNSRHKGGSDCSFMDMEFESELIRGYSSEFNFRCKMCGVKEIFSSENKHNDYLPINKALVNATLAIGIIFYFK